MKRRKRGREKNPCTNIRKLHAFNCKNIQGVAMKSEEKGKQANHSKSLEKSTWKTVRQDWPKLLKVPRDSSASSVKRPPKICIPSKAKMKIKRMSRTKRALMEAMELTKLLTRLPMEAQYLEERVQPNSDLKI